MREILFRAKRVDTGEWVEGYYCPCVFGSFPASPAIICAEDLKNGRWKPTRVWENTLCEYTGLKDKNGRKIFEGDILCYDDSIECKYLGYVRNEMETGDCCGDGIYGWTLSEEGADFYGVNVAGYNCIKVIGNIYDNPELLEEMHRNET